MATTSAYEAGKSLLCGDYSQYTPTGKSYFVRAGRYGKLPSVGDIQYNFTKSAGRVAHVALVEECSIDYKARTFTVKTIEGNTSPAAWDRNGGMVARKTYANVPFDSVGRGKDSHIDGFGSPYYTAFTCGVQDILEAARGELGYIEKASAAGIGDYERAATAAEKTANRGAGNFTKYGKWYGRNGVAWCQQFISWCAWYGCRLALARRKTGWEEREDGWHYLISGAEVKDRWLEVGGRWYAFDGSGKMITGWLLSEGIWYYMNPADGAMLASQWVQHKGDWYYLTSSGAMAADAFVEDAKGFCYLSEKGIWDGKYVSHPGPGAEICR